ncbi:ABC transporter permease [Microbacterium hydrocarbonoxydans]|uniref:Peptide/nickel transport system permease protein n=1 Tax=Microbacterium hydrocarbonoxydans TaxID=273678 RepID=A0A1H4L5Z3_9MICO|nr:ABC transporter permease [Microbacterium hydrocarbonoxydans]SEB66177.1 peptide/nickel transport system permease protein [Microbacterium hydrocarbonoxydans]
MRALPVLGFIGRRLLALAALLFVVSFIVFSLVYLAPGSAIDVLLGDQPRTPETVALLEAKYHLDQPFLVQFWYWLQGAVHLDFGESIRSTLPVADEIFARLPVTVFLAVYAFLLELVIGLTVGVLAAYRQRSMLDRGLVSLTVVGLSTPAFVSGVVVLYIFAVALGLFPAFGAGEGFLDRLWHLTLPAVALAIVGSAFIVKNTRAAVIAVLDEDFVTFARARGMGSAHVLFRYVLRNALIPILGISAMLLSHLLVGAVFVEVTFSISGIGDLIVSAANSQDLPMIQGVTLFVAIIVMGFNLLADLAYIAVDPRVQRRVLA